jgi:ribonuclease D
MFFAKDPHIITDDAALVTLCEHLSQQSQLSVDLEGDSLHHFKEKLCLMQISDSEEDYIVDLITISDFEPMKQILENPAILKVMHGADYDVVSLKRDYDCAIHNLFDTGIAAQFLNYPKIGLANLIERHFGLVLEKQYQKHDWSRRPLWDEHIQYARSDTHFLLSLYEILCLQLQRKGLLEAALEESEYLTQREWNGRLYDGLDFLRIKKANQLSKTGLRVLRVLFDKRDELAEQRDSPVFHLAADAALWAIANTCPETGLELEACVPSKYKGTVKRHKSVWLSCIEEGLADERPLPSLPKAAKRHPKNKWLNELVNQLKEWRVLQQQDGIHDYLLPTNNQIKDIALRLPKDLEELMSLGICRRWQVQHWGQKVLDVVQSIVNA